MDRDDENMTEEEWQELIDSGDVDPDDEVEDTEAELDEEDNAFLIGIGAMRPLDGEDEPAIQWVPVKGFTKLYEVNIDGQVRSIKSGKILKQRKAKTGYWDIGLSKNGKTYKSYVHILTWESWNSKEKINKDEIISHENQNFDDCSIDNLRKRTRKANAILNQIHRRNLNGKTKASSKTK